MASATEVVARGPIGGGPIDGRLHLIRGQRVIVDADLASLYGVSSKRLSEQVRRNLERFPSDFMFRLTLSERNEVLALHPSLHRIKSSRAMPRAFTEHGALMAANVLDSDTAVQVSIEIVRAFVRVRALVAQHHDLFRRLDALERKYDHHDRKFKAVFEAVRALMAPEDGSGRRIGFRAEDSV